LEDEYEYEWELSQVEGPVRIPEENVVMSLQELDVLLDLLHGLLQLSFSSYFHGSINIERELLIVVVDLLPVGLETTD
jgi:hypothetical protein